MWQNLSRAAQDAGVTIGVLVDVDLGMKRTGVPTAKDALMLCRQISASPGLRFDGLMGYEGHTLMIADPGEKRAAIASAIAKLLETRDLAEQRATVAGSSPPADLGHTSTRRISPE